MYRKYMIGEINMRTSVYKFIGGLIPMSLVVYNINWKLGAAVGILALVLLFFCNRNGVYTLNISRLCRMWGVYLLVFAVGLQILRSYDLTISYVIGYLLVSLLLFVGIPSKCTYTLVRCLKVISIIEATGIFVQILLPGVYSFFMRILVSDLTLQSITERVNEGYYTGFTREVSLTVLFLVTGIGLSTVQFFKHRESFSCRKKRQLILEMLYLWIALFFTGKRAQPIFCILALVVTYLVYSDTKNKYIKISLLLILSVVIYLFAIPVLISIPSISRYVSLIQNLQTNQDIAVITSGRTEIYQTAIELWNGNRVFGIGWNNFKNAVPSTAWFSRFDVHNVYLQVLCENGYVGAILYYILFFASMCRMLHTVAKKRITSDLLAFDIFYYYFFLLYSITGTCLYEYSYYIIFFLALIWGEQEIVLYNTSYRGD